jgi:BNR repeat protein
MVASRRRSHFVSGLGRRLTVLPLIGIWLVAIGLQAVAGSTSLVDASPGTSPFASCPDIGPPFGSSDFNTVNTEIEPRMAIDPTNANNMIAVYQQDRWRNGGARGLVASISRNGGSSWVITFPSFSQCSGNSEWNRASDPWVTFDPAGNAYFIALTSNADETHSGILVSKLTHAQLAGKSSKLVWSAPVTLIDTIGGTLGLGFNDKESITADPTRPGTVYAVWDQSSVPGQDRIPGVLHAFSYRQETLFSRTTDFGATWSTPTALFFSNQVTLGNQIVVEPNGNLADVFWASKGSGIQPNENSDHQAAMYSSDGGLHWSPPQIVSDSFPLNVVDPNNGNPVRAGTNIPDVGVDPNTGALYVVWADGRFSGFTHNDIALTRSTDGGKTWSPAQKVNQTTNGAAAFTASAHVLSNGTIGVTYYDFRNNNGSGLNTDYFLVQSSDGGVSWHETRLTPSSFNMEWAPISRGYFTGDYEGLTSAGAQWRAVFIQTIAPLDTDTFVATTP